MFLDKTSFSYNSKHKDTSLLRGAETALIAISKTLQLGHEITIINNCQK